MAMLNNQMVTTKICLLNQHKGRIEQKWAMWTCHVFLLQTLLAITTAVYPMFDVGGVPSPTLHKKYGCVFAAPDS